MIVILRVHLPGAPEYEIGDEIWQQSLADAIAAEAQTIASYAGPELAPSPDEAHREPLRDQIIHEMTRALVGVGDEYQALDGVRYSLLDQSASDPGRLRTVTSIVGDPVVEQVLRFENLPLGSAGSRRAFVRWSNGSQSVAVTFYADEILFSEGDLLGKTQAQIQSLHFRRDRDWLQS